MNRTISKWHSNKTVIPAQSVTASLAILVLFACACLSSSAGLAASPDFQDFLTDACAFAEPGSDFDRRCNVDAVDGDLSADSEDSLNPTQSLSNGANALAETRARIKALQAKLKTRHDEEGEQETEDTENSVMTTFRMSGFSFLLNAEHGNLERELTLFERGYETDSIKVQLGLDYRLRDNWIVGALIGMDRYETVFDADSPGTNFLPGDSEGDTDADNININLFTTATFAENCYVDALITWSRSDYTFTRIGLFQESTRTLPTVPVNTRAEADGDQLAASFGFGLDRNYGANGIHIYGRVFHQSSSIDSYVEQGGAGFAMRFDSEDVNETIGTVGAKFTRSINTDFGILVPQLFVEYENAFNDETADSVSSFVADNSRTRFVLTGDDPDNAYTRAGIALLAGFPNGFTAYVGVNNVFGQDHLTQLRYTAGLRKEM